MTTDADNKTTFKDVAGLIEEKEEFFINYFYITRIHFLTQIDMNVLNISTFEILFVVIVLMFSFLSSQMGGGGGNSKVMNFGKSRACHYYN